MKTKERIHKLVIKPEDIEAKTIGSISSHSNLLLCPYCKSPLHYTITRWGVVAEESLFQTLHNRDERCYSLREVGLWVYCAECGDSIDDYSKWFYPEDKMVLDWTDLDEVDDEERAEIKVCLSQFNQKGTFKARYKSSVFERLKEELINYEKEHPIKKKEVKKKK